MDLKKLAVRAGSGIIYVAVIVGCLLWGIIPFSYMTAFFAAIATIEFIKITRGISKENLPLLLLDVAASFALAFGWMMIPICVWILILLLRMSVQLFTDSTHPLKDITTSLATQIYIALPLAVMAYLALITSLHIVLALFMMIWINDTGAFLVGSSFGKHRLFERISPKKSWEGFFGGLLFNLIAAAIFHTFFSDFFKYDLSLTEWIVLGILVTIAATLGDLFESMIKRNLHIKDSGNIIPGHGGILDRIDSLLFVMPAAFLFFMALIIF